MEKIVLYLSVVDERWFQLRGLTVRVPEYIWINSPQVSKQCLLLFGELARRKRKGVIIAIDEVENSLHPTLQRLVMWNLRKIAREWDAQVIVTTHSLEIINTVRG
ncbi:MAG: ATP-binding protein [Anaerolineales bacterium]|nr:ATP-binding protein [Anaerolineales bacterium]